MKSPIASRDTAFLLCVLLANNVVARTTVPEHHQACQSLLVFALAAQINVNLYFVKIKFLFELAPLYAHHAP